MSRFGFVRRVLGRWSWLAAVGPLALLAAGNTGCSRNPATGRAQLNLLTSNQEVALGQQAAPEVMTEFGGPMPDERVQAWIRGLGADLARRSERPDLPWEFTAVQTDVPNALALPGGQIMITKGLMQLAETEEEVAAALAHEVGHVTAKHVVDMLQRQLGTQVLLAAISRGTGSAQAAQAAQVVGSLLNLKYSRDQELEADRLGARYLVESGRNPYAMVALMEKLGTMEKGGAGGLGEFLRTHPHSQRRVESLQTLIAEQYPQFRQENLPHTVPPALRIVHEMPSGQPAAEGARAPREGSTLSPAGQARPRTSLSPAPSARDRNDDADDKQPERRRGTIRRVAPPRR